MSTEEQVAALQAQVAQLQATVEALNEVQVKGSGPCPCGGREVHVFGDGSASCQDCGTPLQMEGKALDLADEGLWVQVEQKAALLLGAADLDQLREAHAELTGLLVESGVVALDVEDDSADMLIKAMPTEEQPDPVAVLAARRAALGS